MHIVKSDAYTNAYRLQARNVVIKLCACIICIHEYAHILHTHTHLRTQTHKHTHNYTCIKTFIPTHTSICQHPRIYPHTSILAQYSRVLLTYTCARALKQTRAYAYKTKNAFTDTTHNAHTHRYTHTLTHAYEYASALRNSSALRIFTPIHLNIHLCTRIYVCARTSMNNKNQHVRSQADIQTCMHALNHSRSHIHIRECVRSVCVYVYVRSVCVHVCGCARVIVLYCKRVLEYACV